jgi:hypothetical protein
MRNKPSPADIDLAINQAKHGGWIDPTDEPDCWECLLAKPTGGAMRALCLILALVAGADDRYGPASPGGRDRLGSGRPILEVIGSAARHCALRHRPTEC